MSAPLAQPLDADALPQIVEVLADAFHDYPVMRYMLGAGENYDANLHRLVNLFASARVLREEPMFGVRLDGELAAVGLASYPAQSETPAAVAALREDCFARLGEGPRTRYETFGSIASQFHVDEAHVHLNMIGVRRALQGRGLARRILETVHEFSRSTGWSSCVTLSTELESNLPFYRHFGYEVLGSAPVEDAFTTWAMVRRPS